MTYDFDIAIADAAADEAEALGAAASWSKLERTKQALDQEGSGVFCLKERAVFQRLVQTLLYDWTGMEPRTKVLSRRDRRRGRLR